MHSPIPDRGGALSEPINSGSPVTVRGLPRTSDLVVKFTLENENSELSVTATIGGSPVGTYDPNNPDGPTLTIQASEITGNINIAATAGYIVTLNNGDDSTPSQSKIVAVLGSQMPTEDIDGNNLAIPSKEGHTFGGYYVDVDDENTKYYDEYLESVKQWDKNEINITLYAKWTANRYTITFDQENVTTAGTSTLDVVYGATIPNIPLLPIRTGYTMDGYYTAGVHLGTCDPGTAFDGYKYLTFDGVSGRWIIIGVYDNTNYGNAFENKDELDPGQVLLLSENVLEDCAYDNTDPQQANWSTSEIRKYLNGEDGNGGFYESSGLINYNIVPQGLTTAWKNENNEITTNQTGAGGVEPADKIFLLATIHGGDGYGTNVQNFCVETYLGNEKDARLKDHVWWLRSGHNSNFGLAYNVNSSGSIVSEYVDDPSLGLRPAFVLDMNGEVNQIYNGAGQPVPESWGIDHNITLYAKWTPKTHALTFNANGGNDCTEKTVTYNAPIGGLPIPTREGYDFAGWKIDNTTITDGDNYTWTASREAVAQWTGNAYTLTFNANGGSVDSESKSVTFGDAIGDLPVPTYPGYTFTGWKINEGTENISINSTTTYTWAGDQTAVAQWTAT